MKLGKEKIVQIAICDGNLESCLESGGGLNLESDVMIFVVGTLKVALGERKIR